ncbi:MAG: hypothetical protein D6738_02545 [Acidobacteria bacterium]|nr:MAG: hypothetical protein D6738_02545 [Acidobacteriota bacterium]
MQVSQPKRASRTYVQRLHAVPEEVFPLLCPVREVDWVEGWAPSHVWSESGVAEKDCVFLTGGHGGEAVWYITCHEPALGRIEMLKVTPGVTICSIVIELAPSGPGTAATITYTHTSLGPAGDEFGDQFTEEHWVRFMQAWESQLNHYLKTGRKSGHDSPR